MFAKNTLTLHNCENKQQKHTVQSYLSITMNLSVLVGWSLTSLFSTNTATSETNPSVLSLLLLLLYCYCCNSSCHHHHDYYSVVQKACHWQSKGAKHLTRLCSNLFKKRWIFNDVFITHLLQSLQVKGF